LQQLSESCTSEGKSTTALDAPSKCAKDLASIARHAGSHIVRRGRHARTGSLVGTNVFIGHGRSPAWRDLKDLVKDRLGLPLDEFNRVPVAGVTNIARLSEMLDAAAIAFLVLTAEDERTDGTSQARMNVIHEVGLFQGRLGFTKAIVLLEEGCAEFTNIQGLGQIDRCKLELSDSAKSVRPAPRCKGSRQEEAS
jgi:predicted nucleotide-binding protein